MSRRKLLLANNPLLSGPKLGDRDRIGIPYRELPLASIQRDPKQPRLHFDEERLKELSESIKLYGVLSPILVKTGPEPGKYTVISGERRLRASQLAGKQTIPALIDQSEESSQDRTLAMQLVENLQRADLNPLERAHAIGALRDSYKLSIRDIAEKLSISKSMVQRSLEILELPDDLLNALREGASESKVLLLAKIEDEQIRASYLKDIDVLTRGQLQKEMASSTTAVSNESNLSAEDVRLVDDIQRAIGLKVKLHRTSRDSQSGRLVIEMYSDSDFKEVYRKLISA